MTAVHKRGDTFDRSGPITVSQDGVALPDLTGWTGRCQVRTQTDELIDEPVFSWINAASRICRIRSASTSAWPTGPAEIDIELTSPSGDTVSTQTAEFEIVKDITRGA